MFNNPGWPEFPTVCLKCTIIPSGRGFMIVFLKCRTAGSSDGVLTMEGRVALMRKSGSTDVSNGRLVRSVALNGRVVIHFPIEYLVDVGFKNSPPRIALACNPGIWGF